MAQPPSGIVIECVWPEVNGGKHPIKRCVGDTLTVLADIFKEGHDVMEAALLYRCACGASKRTAGESPEPRWARTAFQPLGNDRWSGSFLLDHNCTFFFTVEAWPQRFDTWQRETLRKRDARQEIASDLLEGRGMLRAIAARATATDRDRLRTLLAQIETDDADRLAAVLLSPEAAELARRYPDAQTTRRHDVNFEIICDRPRARCGAWYEMFPRSQGTDPTRSATFRECEARLPEIQRMGFDVLYLPPIHPIGHTKRKGPNNSLAAAPGDPGSPYAIGSEQGGHCAVEPSLGTLDDFDRFTDAVHRHGMEIALDFAINCSPDHPYVRQHPEWFFHRPDGSIKYAENPPKRYEDVYPLNFYTDDWQSLWEEMLQVLLFWIRHRVRIFRVDNPHTKPMPFWSWLLGRIRAEYPDVIFLSEAFTRPKVMKHLAKIGYQQSYTYFTWRNNKQEITDYLRELADGPCREYFRPNFFTNTPDILPEILQKGGRPAFQMRFVLAATLSPNYGIYNGFELCEGRAVPGTEEYQDSEKYQFKVWDWDRPGNIKDLITRVNQIRRENPALQRLDGVRFLPAGDPNILFYAKTTPDLATVLLIAVNMDPFQVHEADIEIPLSDFGMGDDQPFQMTDLLTGGHRTWRGRHHRLRLDPQQLPAQIYRLR